MEEPREDSASGNLERGDAAADSATSAPSSRSGEVNVPASPGPRAAVALELGQEPPSSDPDQYKVKLEAFEGPLDLLLYLIRKEEVSIYDIPIARITEQYLDYLRIMQELDIGVAGEFLVMAATLIHIKSQMLLPRDPDASPEEDDPRNELVYQLLEHQKFKAAANVLYQRRTIEGAAFTRASIETDEDNPEVAATVFQLFEVFRQVLDRQRAITEIEIAREEMTMAEKLAEIKSLVTTSGEVSARELFERARSRRELVLIFLAVLELVKELVIRLRQSEMFGDIILAKRDEGA
ncbi:MAG TPA: segregation/condensation protein A [Blastocatellia bacterium]|nr:segregation/condensation protein A [Blastocatellia bacterium]